ncbi:MAG: hypothetical protein EOO39_09090 [Cytophagaceae bacterium]|nr:MAG: hypothetical protein EOO39_09090 [Cytophagaceae bacterium]
MTRLSKGYTNEEAAGIMPIKMFGGEVTAGGRTFRTLQAAATHYGLDPINVHKRVKKLGWSVDEALGIVHRHCRRGQYKRK